MSNAAESITDIDSLQLEQPILHSYFQSINQGSFQATAALFSDIGVLHAPFESPIQGREAIADYLASQAKGMILIPNQVVAVEPLEFLVQGKVRTSLFLVNVAWQFWLNSHNEIAAVKVKLLASPQELLNLRQHQP